MIAREPVFEVAPQTFDGIEFGGIGREKEQPDIGWQAQLARFMKGAIVEQEEVEGVRIGGGEVVEEELKALGIKGRQLEEEVVAGEGFDYAIQIEALKTIGRGQQGLEATGRDAMAQDGQEPTTAFVLCPQP